MQTLLRKLSSLVRFSLMWKGSDRGQVPQTARPRHWPSSEPGHFFSQHVHQIQLASPDFLESLVSRRASLVASPLTVPLWMAKELKL
jgi:hypothetical protein